MVHFFVHFLLREPCLIAIIRFLQYLGVWLSNKYHNMNEGQILSRIYRVKTNSFSRYCIWHGSLRQYAYIKTIC